MPPLFCFQQEANTMLVTGRIEFPEGLQWLSKPFWDMSHEEWLAVRSCHTVWRLMRIRMGEKPPAFCHRVRSTVYQLGIEKINYVDMDNTVGNVREWAIGIRQFIIDTVKMDDPSLEHYLWDAYLPWSWNGMDLENFGLYSPVWADDPGGRVAVYASIGDLIRNRRTAIKVGRFFRRLYPTLDDSTIEDVVQFVRSRVGGTEIKYAVTADEIADVYSHGPNSCMAGEGMKKYWKGRYYHPAEVYCYPHDRKEMGCPGDNGVYVAYFGDIYDAPARAVVRHYPDGTKEFVRVYGDNLLCSLLEAAGYEHNPQALDGARLSIVGNHEDGYLIPYLDGGWDGLIICDEDGQRYGLVTDDNPVIVSGTAGWWGGYDYHCGSCGVGINEGDAYWIEDEDVYVCDGCYESEYTVAYSSRWVSSTGQWRYDEQTVRSEYVVYVEGVGCCTEVLAREISFQCDRCGDWYEFEYINHICEDDDGSYCDRCVESERYERGLILAIVPDKYATGWILDYAPEKECVGVEGLERPVWDNGHIDSITDTCPDCGQLYYYLTSHDCEVKDNEIIDNDRTPSPYRLQLID
jgi:hypothetical protein